MMFPINIANQSNGPSSMRILRTKTLTSKWSSDEAAISPRVGRASILLAFFLFVPCCRRRSISLQSILRYIYIKIAISILGKVAIPGFYVELVRFSRIVH